MSAEIRWEIVTHRIARKDLRPFRHVLNDLEAKIAVLATRPDAGEELDGTLKGVRALKFSLKGIGECRVAYFNLATDRICVLFLYRLSGELLRGGDSPSPGDQEE